MGGFFGLILKHNESENYYNLIFSDKNTAETIQQKIKTNKIVFGKLPSTINGKFSLMTFNPKNLGTSTISYPYYVTNNEKGVTHKLKIVVNILNPNDVLTVY